MSINLDSPLRSESCLTCRVVRTLDRKLRSAIPHCPDGQSGWWFSSAAPCTSGGIGTRWENTLEPVYCCCRKQSAQYSTECKSSVQELR